MSGDFDSVASLPALLIPPPAPGKTKVENLNVKFLSSLVGFWMPKESRVKAGAMNALSLGTLSLCFFLNRFKPLFF